MALEGMAASASGLFMTVFRVIIWIVVIAICFFGSRYFFKRRNYMKNFKINALVTNPDGSHMHCRIGKFKDKDSMNKMLFLTLAPGWFGFKSWQIWKGESMAVINPKNIVNLSIQLFRYGPSQYAVIPPTVYRAVDIKKFKIDLINMHMLEFKGLEQRAGISRWAATKKTLQDLAPWITLGILVIGGGVIAYFIIKLGMVEFAKVTAARVAECSSLIGGGSAPIA